MAVKNYPPLFQNSEWEDDNEPMQIVFDKNSLAPRIPIRQKINGRLPFVAWAALFLFVAIWTIRRGTRCYKNRPSSL